GPPEPQKIRGFVFKLLEKKATGAVPSPDRITLLRDADGDGVAEVKTVLIDHLHGPFGMALVGDQLYIANADAIVKVPFRRGETKITATPQKVTDLPGGFNH